MTQIPEVALCVVTYQRPRSLALVLESIAAQRDIPGQIEVIVSDDGSTDQTPEVVDDFRLRVDFPVTFITHPHLTFQAARCRNAAVANSRSEYLVFVDGDCILPPYHVATHLRQRRRGVAICGDAGRVDQATSQQVTAETIRRGDFSSLLSLEERRRLRRLDFSTRFYSFIRHPTKPRWFRSGDFSIWREDFARVNGFDENFCGWGGEDDDFGRRLRRAGIRFKSVLRRTRSYHLWHAPDVTRPPIPSSAPNAAYMRRQGKLIRCRNGLVKRDWNEIAVRIVGDAVRSSAARQMIAGRIVPRFGACDPEIELLFLPGAGKFSGAADCNILVALEDSAHLDRLARGAHVVVASRTLSDAPEVLQFHLDEWDRALGAVA